MRPTRSSASGFKFSEKQTKAILDMRLARLTALERVKLEEELKEVKATIKDLKGILGSRERRVSILVDEMQQVAKTFGDDRRTEIIPDQADFAIEDLIAEEDMVITISHSGYIKRIPDLHLPPPAARRARPHRGHRQGRRLDRVSVHREHARLRALLQRQGTGLLAQGSRDPAGRSCRARQAGHPDHRDSPR
jgi:DNA gyrase/topoisomerase IV subunit A